jgi:hypothetical protein
MSFRDDHYQLGLEHARRGEPRYVFQDPALQERYDRGYKEALMGTTYNRCRNCGTKVISPYTHCNGCM